MTKAKRKASRKPAPPAASLPVAYGEAEIVAAYQSGYAAGRASVAPRADPSLDYLSGRWHRRDGTGYGKPPIPPPVQRAAVHGNDPARHLRPSDKR